MLRTIGAAGTGDGELEAPAAIAVDAAGTIYVADTGNGRVARFGPDGSWRGAVGAFTAAGGVAVTPDGSRLYVADGATNRITVLSPDGAVLTSFGGTGKSAGKFNKPSQLALDAAGDLWVAERGGNRVQQLSAEGRPLARFGARGTALGEFVHPTGVALDCHGAATVTDTDNNRLQELALQAPAPAPCAALPPVASAPPPIVTTPPPPPPAPPHLRVRSARPAGVLARRGVTVAVTCDVRCTVAATGTLAPRVVRRGRTLAVHLRPTTRKLPAGKRRVVRLTLPRKRVHALQRALRRRRGLVAQVQLTASVPGAPPTVVTRRLLVRR